MLELNLTAPFRMLRRAVPGMVEHGFGRVVAIASVAAKRGEPYIAAYTASKHGLLGLVRSAAQELATTGVTVNAVCPGYVDTPMTDGTVATISATTGRTPETGKGGAGTADSRSGGSSPRTRWPTPCCCASRARRSPGRGSTSTAAPSSREPVVRLGVVKEHQ